MKTQAINNPLELLPYLKNPLHRIFYVLGLKTGFRVSELLSLEVRDVYLSTGEVRLNITVERKNMKGQTVSRTVPLSPTSRDLIKAQGIPERFNFEQSKLFPFKRIAAHRFLDKARRDAGWEQRVACHSMRKTFAARVFELSDKDLHVTQKALGHASIDSTIRYLEVDQEKLMEVFDKL